MKDISGKTEGFLDYTKDWGFTRNYISHQNGVWKNLTVNGKPLKSHENHGNLTYKVIKKMNTLLKLIIMLSLMVISLYTLIASNLIKYNQSNKEILPENVKALVKDFFL